MNSFSIQHDPVKRIFDLSFSLFALLFSLPLFLFLSLFIKLSSPGPLFYKSERLGRGGRPIACWKFRTMYVDAGERLKALLASDEKARNEWQTYQKLRDDPRITPIGHILRKTSLDEWPQFWNVLRGDLSIVGPRPPVLMGPKERFLEEIRSLYGDKTDLLLSVRPGLTGIWQVSGRSRLSFAERTHLESHYIENRSFLKDLWLICKTIPAILFAKGAY